MSTLKACSRSTRTHRFVSPLKSQFFFLAQSLSATPTTHNSTHPPSLKHLFLTNKIHKYYYPSRQWGLHSTRVLFFIDTPYWSRYITQCGYVNPVSGIQKLNNLVPSRFLTAHTQISRESFTTHMIFDDYFTRSILSFLPLITSSLVSSLGGEFHKSLIYWFLIQHIMHIRNMFYGWRMRQI